MPDPVLAARGRLAYASRKGGDPGALEAARREFKEAKLRKAIQEAVASAPPLSPEQRDRLAALLAGGAP